MKSILDPNFRYTSSAATDLRKTFARIRKEQKQQKEYQEQPEAQELINRLMDIRLTDSNKEPQK